MRSCLVGLLTLLCGGCGLLPLHHPDIDDVPSAILVAGTETQAAEIGGFCWSWGGGIFAEVGTCTTDGNLQTPSSPLQVKRAQRLQVVLPEGEGPAEVEVCWIHTGTAAPAEGEEIWTAWDPPPEDCEQRSSVQVLILVAPRSSGHHALSVFADWSQSKNFAWYGFSLEVTP